MLEIVYIFRTFILNMTSFIHFLKNLKNQISAKCRRCCNAFSFGKMELWRSNEERINSWIHFLGKFLSKDQSSFTLTLFCTPSRRSLLSGGGDITNGGGSGGGGGDDIVKPPNYQQYNRKNGSTNRKLGSEKMAELNARWGEERLKQKLDEVLDLCMCFRSIASVRYRSDIVKDLETSGGFYEKPWEKKKKKPAAPENFGVWDSGEERLAFKELEEEYRFGWLLELSVGILICKNFRFQPSSRNSHPENRNFRSRCCQR